MRKVEMLAALVVTSSLVACRDRAPQVIAVPSGEIPRPGQMTVTGQATLEISPDCADLTITLGADSPRPGTATAGVDAKETALVTALEKLGVERKDVKLSQLSLDPIYEPQEEHHTFAPLKIHTYRAQITITATTRDFAKIGAMMDAGANAGASAMSSAFRRSDLAALKKQVRDMALTAAKDKAKQTADALGIRLGRVVTVAENPGGAMWGNAYFPSSNVAVVRDAGVALGGALQSLTLDVTIGYELAKDA
jgi:uncharacterized protein YggE